MKEAEFTLSSDNKNWMDTSVISDIPRKATIIDPRNYVAVLRSILESLQSIQEENYSRRQLEAHATRSFHAILSAMIYGRRAWVNGEDAALSMYPMSFKKAFGSELDPIVRDKIRYELDFDLDELSMKRLGDFNIESVEQSKQAAIRLTHFLQDVSTMLNGILSPNLYMIHELTISKDGRVLWIEEFCDWRVKQWTVQEQAKVDAANAIL